MVDKNSSISNSNRSEKLPKALLLTLAFILMTELSLGFYLKKNDLWNSVLPNYVQDVLNFNDVSPEENTEVIVLGDSTARLLKGLCGGDSPVENFSTNANATLAGHYFLLRDAYRNGLNPRFVILLFSIGGLYWEIDIPTDHWHADNYLYKPFFSTENIAELTFETQRPDMGWNMFMRGGTPTIRYRHEMIKFLKNKKIIKDHPQITAPISKQKNSYSLRNYFIKNYTDKPNYSKGMTNHYFKKIAELAKENNSKLIFIETYVPQSKYQREDGNLKTDYKYFVKTLLNNKDNLSQVILRKFQYPDSHFFDQTHLANKHSIKDFSTKTCSLIKGFLKNN